MQKQHVDDVLYRQTCNFHKWNTQPNVMHVDRRKLMACRRIALRAMQINVHITTLWMWACMGASQQDACHCHSTGCCTAQNMINSACITIANKYLYLMEPTTDFLWHMLQAILEHNV